MNNHDCFFHLTSARILARTNGFTNTEAALAKLIDDHAENLNSATPDWRLVSVADMQLTFDDIEETSR